MNQRKKNGDVEGFEADLNHWLKFKIWKVEREWEEEQAKAAKTSNKMRNAHKCKQRERLDKSNIENKWRKAKKQNKRVDISKENTEYTQNLELDTETETACDPEAVGEKPREMLSPKKITKGAKAMKSAACDLTHGPAGGENPNSAFCNRGPR